MNVRFRKYVLDFKQPSGTSRGVLRQKETYFIEITDGQRYGIGECGLFRGLSFDDVPHYETQLQKVCVALEKGNDVSALCTSFPSIQMGVEMAKKAGADIVIFANQLLRSSFTAMSEMANNILKNHLGEAKENERLKGERKREDKSEKVW